MSNNIFNIENFENINKDTKILQDISKNPLPTPNTDIINYNNRNNIDLLINDIKNKQDQVNKLSLKINNDTINTVTNINNNRNFSGRNIFFTSAPKKNIYNNLTPIAIVNKDQILEYNITNKLNTDSPLNAQKNEWGFQTSMYELAQLVERDNTNVLVSVPYKITSRAPVLSNMVNAAATRISTNKVPNLNHTFNYSIQAIKPNIPNRINDFNLSYVNPLPMGLLTCNFLSIGYNGHVYVGVDVQKINKSSKTNFLDDLINNHVGSLNASVNYGCMLNSKLCGNQINSSSFNWQEFFDDKMAMNYGTLSAIDEATKNWFSEIINKEEEQVWLDKAVEAENNPNNITNEIVWFSMLTDRFNQTIVGPPINKKLGIKQTYLNGGLHPYKFLGCYKDYPPPNRLLPTYVGIKSADDCIKYATENDYTLAGLQDGAPGGVGRGNWTNGQCWVSKSSFNELPKCDPAHKKEEGWWLWRHSVEVPESGACLQQSNDCQGNPKIGNSWTNAIYKINNAPQVKPTTLYIQGYGITKFIPGSLILKYPNSEGEMQYEVIWKPNINIKQQFLFPYSPENDKPGVTEITNSKDNLQYIWSNDTKSKVLYSSDYYFKLEINAQLNKKGVKQNTFMNTGNMFNKLNRTKPNILNIIDPNNTGIKVNLNTDISKYDIQSKDENINALFQVIRKIDPISVLPMNMGDYRVVFNLSGIKNDLLGDMGFINYNDKPNSVNNNYKISMYNSDYKPFTNTTSKFIDVEGTINKNLLPGKTFSPFYNEIDNNISVTKVNSESECKRICFNNLEECQAWEVDNKDCWTYNSKTNDVKKLLEAQMPVTLFNPKAYNKRFNLRVPNIENNKTCPDTIKDPIINGELPTTSNNIKNSYISWNNFKDNIFWNFDKPMDKNSYCNVQKIINNDEIKLKNLEDQLLVLLNKFDSLMQSLEKKEQDLYKNLLNQQLQTNNINKQFNTIKKGIDKESNGNNTQRTLEQSVDDSVFNLINSNYNFIVWVVLAISIILAAIYFSRNKSR